MLGAFTKFILKVGLILTISLSCTSDYNSVHEKTLESDKNCIQFYENIAKEYLTDTLIEYVVMREQIINADDKHKLLKRKAEQDESSCNYRGLRDYGQTIVIEIASWKKNNHRMTSLKIFERHFLLVGDWENFDINQLFWRENERIIHEEIIGNNSKLVVTDCF